MTRCLDEGKLQGYFDGELSIEMMESVTSHLASCVTCAAAARELEEESALLTAALAMEFEASVPTERLRERINEAVLGDRLAIAQSTAKAGGLAGFLSGLLNFGTQRTLGYASLAVVLAFAAIVGIVKMRTSTVAPPQVDKTTAQAGNIQQTNNSNAVATASPKQVSTETPKAELPRRETAKNFVAVSYKKPASISTAPKPAQVKLIPGERSYLQAIARLDSTIKSNKKSMRPALQVEFERNLAVVDRAIAATRSAAKSNPNDPDAADFMFAAYQSKVDLLNTIADARVGGGRGH
ncbi:MAG TPA: zf-HC2 domain-containing protein [Pyrinomonadaceae bacterium]|nr:zf-HC2 domain-containing protein [Pyrinomonadaceae bacterium]